MTHFNPIAIIQMGVPPTAMRQRLGEPAQWFAQALGVAYDALLVVRPDLDQALPDPDQFCVAIITGSWSMVTDQEAWSERTATWARGLIEREAAPLLGICYGHQLMAHAMGGVVDYLPGGRELGAFPVTLNEAGRTDPLLQSRPARFTANLSHAQAVLKAPEAARVLASSARDAHQILRYHDKALSMQFHPEFTPEILAACMAGHQKAGHPAPAATTLPATPQARQILLDFVHPYLAQQTVQLAVS